MSSAEIKSAYLRSLEKSSQCDLRFWLTVTHPKFGSINQEIKSLRQLSDTVESLLGHTRNIIIKLLQDQRDGQLQSEELNLAVSVSLSRNGREFASNMQCKELFDYKNKIRFKIFDIEYRVVVNAPLIYQLTIPKSIYIDACIKPQRLSGIHLHKALSKYKWSRSKDLIQWTDVFYEETYNTSKEDLNHYIKLTLLPYSKDRTPGPEIEVTSECTVGVLGDIPEVIIQLDYRNAYTQHKLKKKDIRIVTYNILAERYTDDQFTYCDPKHLSIEYRKKLIIQELINYKADIICLQEVDLEHYHQYFKVQLKLNGYFSKFYKKGHVIPEGLMFAFDKHRFKQIALNHIVLSQQLARDPLYKEIWNVVKKQKEVKELFMKQHTSLLTSTLKLLHTNDILIIANTHLYYHCEANHIRFLQIAMALKYIENQIKIIKAKERANISVIFCGDFNSRPDSAVYEFMTQGKLNKSWDNLESIGQGKANVFQHNMGFFSACGTPEFTNYTDDFKGCLDYIFCQNHIKLLQSLPFPAEEKLSRNTALPNQYFPSDHLSLVADLHIG